MRLAPLVLGVLLAGCAHSSSSAVTGATPPPTPQAPAARGAPPAAPREEASTVKVTILSTMLSDDGIGEWGFSALVEVDGDALLFDTGMHPDTVLRNAEDLHVDLTRVTDVVLSHNHGDHTGGLVTLRRTLMAKNPAALSRAHVAPPIFWSRPDASGGEGNSMIAKRRDYEALGGTFVEHRGFERLARGVYVTGLVPRVHPERNYGRHGQIGSVVTPTGPVSDDIPEDMALVIVTHEGLVVVVGCGHAGIVNTLEHAVASTGESRVDAVVGGLHLYEKPEDTLEWTAKSLLPMHVAYFIGAHCTGIEATYRLRALLGLERRTAVVGAVGATFELGKGIDPGEIAQ
jgi:7,8-dihydropterin-6-yl-methyl-4-(beta-D-ribofuranosyl)aminobenzene 5'-phosphate synthase